MISLKPDILKKLVFKRYLRVFFFGFHPLVVFLVAFSSCVRVQLPPVELNVKEPAVTMNWEMLSAEALKHNPDIRSAKSGIDSAARSRDIAAGDYLPSITGAYDRGSARSGSGSVTNNTGFGLSAQESFFDGFGTTGRVLQARKNLESARLAYEETSANVRYRLRVAYVDLLGLERLVEVKQKIENRRSQNAEMVRLRYEAGREHLGSALRADAISEQSALDVRQTLRQVETQFIRLWRELGGSIPNKLEVSGNLENMIPALSESRPDYRELVRAVPTVKKSLKTAEAYKAAIIAAQGSVWPQVDGSARYGYSGEHSSDLKKESFLGLKISVPFFSGGKNVSAIRKAKADYESAREAARSARDETVAQLAADWAGFLDAVEQVKIREYFLIAARKRADIVRVQYETGLVGFQDFDIAEQEFADSERNYVLSLANALKQEARWNLSKGATLEEVVHVR